MSTFCPRCGTARLGAFQFCRTCGYDFEGTAEEPIAPPGRGEAPRPPPSDPVPPSPVSAAAPTQAVPTTSPNTNVPLLAGISWLIAAALTGFLAYQQWTIGQVFGSSELQASAGWNAIACVVTLYFAARLLGAPSRKLLDRSVVWAILSVASGIIQIVGLEGTSDVFAGAILAAGAAGVLSFVGRQQSPAAAATGSSVPSTTTSEPASVPTPMVSTAATTRTGFGGAEKLMIALIVVSVVAGGGVIYASLRTGEKVGNVASALPTIRATPSVTPAPDGDLVLFNERVDLVDGNNRPLGAVIVLLADEPADIDGLTAAAGNRIVTARVRYEAEAAWTYNLYDWAMHDASQTQYEPAGIAPEPMLAFGTLAPGRNTEGWVAFEVPNAARVWLDFQSSDGTTIFSVAIP